MILCCLLLAGCGVKSVPAETALPPLPETVPATAPAVPETTVPETMPADPVRQMISDMSLEQRVGQLFLARCNAETAIQDIRQYHLGGLVLFGEDFENQSMESMRQTIAGYQDAAEKPLLIAVDEEGGDVTRVSRYSHFRDRRFSSLRKRYDLGGPEAVLAEEDEKCRLLSDLGINVNLGPVCDITTDSRAFMYSRSLGLSPEDTATAIAAMVQTMNRHQVGSVLKHFPGYGNNTDTHVGIAVDTRSLEELKTRDLVPFAAGIQANCGAILMSHTVVTALDPKFPVSLSLPAHRYLRQKMGFDGVIVTDDLVMGAITKQYGAEEAAVLAVLAGNDLLCSSEYALQYRAVLEAVQSGRIPQAILDAAVCRVLQWKHTLGLL